MAVTVKGARPDSGVTVKCTVGGAAATGAGVGAGGRVGAGCAEGTTTVGTVPAWEMAGTALGSSVAEREGTVDGLVTPADPVSTRVDETGATFTASAANRGLDDTNSPASRRAITATVAYRRAGSARSR
ncbi:MAG TPA: hypothetical protein VHK65_03735 [Candidatus Dormibacteraeota bacterium]|nr:hypothetical protein [Candidatus Dormibacteraeota bacterium]